MTDATTAGERATKQERVDFLKQSMAFTEGNVRAYDVKAQISLAAFVLSGNPLMAAINGACGTSARPVLVIAFVVFIATILAYLWVLWPVGPPAQKLTDGLSATSLFYLPEPLAFSGSSYTEGLKGLAIEPELTAEALKLAFIRSVKARRFKNALIASVIAYLAMTAAFFIVGHCGF